jgi:2-(1,2-epoxy-1,2-dihydrophenyl)acetyl-CoA isomerase
MLREGYNRLIPLLADAPKPVIAAINGPAAGAGVSLALACDVRLASRDAQFSTAFVKIGLVPDSGASWLLPRTIGMAEALRLALTGDRVDAESARGMGLVHEVVPPEALRAEAHALGARLSELPTEAIALTKRLFREASSVPLNEAMELEADFQDRAAATADHIEGVLAFLQKRPPHFTGK